MQEEKKVNEILAQTNQLVKKLNLREVLEAYNEVELTEDEITEAMIWAKRKKLEEVRLAKIKAFEDENRKLKSIRWNFDLIRMYIVARAEKIFGKDKTTGVPNFVIDEFNERVFDLLSYYFVGDEVGFCNAAVEWKVPNPSVKKGLLLAGVYGCGKTWLMKLFSRNNRQSFDVVRAKDITNEYLTAKDKQIPDIYLKIIDTTGDNMGKAPDRAYPSEEVFNQRYIGICIDDLGSEAVQNNYGNKMNVIGDIMESRYAAGFTGVWLHGTTNLSADAIKNFYGGRVASRMREIFNLIELPGSDRRK